jgi:hypothetical protein
MRAPPGRLGFLFQFALAGIAVHPAVWLDPLHREVEQRALLAAALAASGGALCRLQVSLLSR